MEEELRMLTMLERSHPLDHLQSVAEASELVDAQAAILGESRSTSSHLLAAAGARDADQRDLALGAVRERRSHCFAALKRSQRFKDALMCCQMTSNALSLR